eukprot:TRINITY_DN23848_c0_g1_i2.p1 TRINITY_DN23848_c0_g1~~TRINITY_DN23848_c0_g1_i2.p1  ORF type:complete len:632 (-),score=104.52 TRINITY_DN23848_c0_g1_i2:268-2163(-)
MDPRDKTTEERHDGDTMITSNEIKLLAARVDELDKGQNSIRDAQREFQGVIDKRMSTFSDEFSETGKALEQVLNSQQRTIDQYVSDLKEVADSNSMSKGQHLASMERRFAMHRAELDSCRQQCDEQADKCLHRYEQLAKRIDCFADSHDDFDKKLLLLSQEVSESAKSLELMINSQQGAIDQYVHDLTSIAETHSGMQEQLLAQIESRFAARYAALEERQAQSDVRGAEFLSRCKQLEESIDCVKSGSGIMDTVATRLVHRPETTDEYAHDLRGATYFHSVTNRRQLAEMEHCSASGDADLETHDAKLHEHLNECNRRFQQLEESIKCVTETASTRMSADVESRFEELARLLQDSESLQDEVHFQKLPKIESELAAALGNSRKAHALATSLQLQFNEIKAEMQGSVSGFCKIVRHDTDNLTRPAHAESQQLQLPKTEAEMHDVAGKLVRDDLVRITESQELKIQQITAEMQRMVADFQASRLHCKSEWECALHDLDKKVQDMQQNVEDIAQQVLPKNRRNGFPGAASGATVSQRGPARARMPCSACFPARHTKTHRQLHAFWERCYFCNLDTSNHLSQSSNVSAELDRLSASPGSREIREVSHLSEKGPTLSGRQSRLDESNSRNRIKPGF